MINKQLAVVLLVALAVTAVSCGGVKKPDENTSSPDTTRPAPESTIEIWDKNGALLGEIDSRASCTAADGRIWQDCTCVLSLSFRPVA